MANHYGLIGYPLGHSFSKKYFDDKFAKTNSEDTYQLFELQETGDFKSLISNQELKGLNVTIPHKQSVVPFLHKLDKSAELVGAVNVIKNYKKELTGFNTDYPAFKATLIKWLDNTNIKALVLGTGGASKAVIAALNDLKITHQLVSRISGHNTISYKEIELDSTWLNNFKLIINTTPVGMAPNIKNAPKISFDFLTSAHYLYDLVYNPEETKFMRLGNQAGCRTKNGLEMLHLQAELTWDIWNT